ncbi:MerR family transcriptional regulator [Litorimonas sp. WD9-15]|uniref:MerR family transcriptional regulator n=1 Tax=Litorimonas sp. WD9-15 TaxID=3418716 RepID=UPI003D087792
MSQTKTAAKTTRAFRTISEAGDELGLQPHVLRFWESKFSQIKPIKRGGGRRFYRPDDIEFLRGIKTLLHDEKHPIKDVQKLIQKKGAARIAELGRSVEKAARERPVADTDLLPDRIKSVESVIQTQPRATTPIAKPEIATSVVQSIPTAPAPQPTPPPAPVDKSGLQDALAQLESLKSKWGAFRDGPDEA